MSLMLWFYGNIRSFSKEPFKETLNAAFWHPTISNQKAIDLPLHYPLLEPNKTIFIFYNRVTSLKNEIAFFAFKPLFVALRTPTNNLKTTTAPARFFLSYTEIEKGFNVIHWNPLPYCILEDFTNYFWLHCQFWSHSHLTSQMLLALHL